MLNLIPHNTKIDFIGKWKIVATISTLLFVWSLYVWFSLGEAKYGTDFTGGYDFLVETSLSANGDMLRTGMKEAGFGDAVVQRYEANKGQYSVRFGGSDDPTQIKAVKEKVQTVITKVSPEKANILKTDFVGPTIGKELRTHALLATGLGILFLLIYISFRFEVGFALGAVLAVFHDVIIATGVYLAAGHTINMGAVAAALTILGYSVNDTIVVFDRVREQLHNPKLKDLDLASLFNLCINQMLGRTIITTGLTLFSVTALLLFGGGAISDLSFFLFVGMLCGVTSTIYVASPIVLAYEAYQRRREAGGNRNKSMRAAA